jgi:hypothetical protein
LRTNLSALAAFLLLINIASGSQAATYVRVTVDQLVADPAAWDGRLVEVRGLAVSEFENFGL